MIRKLVLILFVAFACSLWAADSDTEKAAVIKVIEDAYLNGVNNIGDPEAMKKGFHEDFSLKGIRDGKLSEFYIAKWIKIVATLKADGKYPPPPELKTRFEYPMIDITGNTAVVKINNFRGGKQIFTDYLLLLKFPDGWKITDKIYFRH